MRRDQLQCFIVWFQHEEASIAMFDHLVKVNKLEAVFEQYQITEKERTFIKEQIAGKPLTGTDTEKKV